MNLFYVSPKISPNMIFEKKFYESSILKKRLKNTNLKNM